MSSRVDSLRLLERWVPFADTLIHPVSGRDDLLVYGPGGHGHWAMQAHATAFSAFAELASNPQTDLSRTGLSRDELWWHAFKMLRFLLQGHCSGSGTCLDGSSWGHSWISALCLERMMHGVEDMEIYLTDEDQEGLCRLLTSECDWLVDHYPVEAGLVEHNKPESNMWNGCLLWRTSLLYPDLPRIAEYEEKGTALLLNAMSMPADADSLEEFGGRPLKEWHRGANFFPSGACNHHGYLNIGYVFVTLSNLAMLHFSGRHFGWELPSALYHHLEDVCRLARSCVFPDGRLLRLGGDTRVRYCYCQDYALAAWRLMGEVLGDSEASSWEAGWLRQVGLEQSMTGNGSFLGRRLKHLGEVSPLYYARLEGDRAASLSMMSCWQRRQGESAPQAVATAAAPLELWSDAHHGAYLSRGKERVASWTWQASEGPQGLLVPSWRSDMAEWRFNLSGRVQGTGLVTATLPQSVHGETFPGGFVTSGWVDIRSQAPFAEGESEENVARTGVAIAALPDGQTAMVLQRSWSLNRTYFREIKGLFLNLPNDLFNGGSRHVESALRGVESLHGRTGTAETLDCGAWLNVDGCLSVRSLDGQPLLWHRTGEPRVCIRQTLSQQHNEQVGGWLYADELCQGACHEGAATCHEAGEELFRAGAAVRVGLDGMKTKEWCDDSLTYDFSADDATVLHGGVRGADGKGYVLVFNSGAGSQQVSVNGERLELASGACWLMVLE